MIHHELGVEWLPSIIATVPSIREHEQGIRAEHARLTAARLTRAESRPLPGSVQ
jgi:hypothetical protein